jgi:RND family efflux transporter MFP subunit
MAAAVAVTAAIAGCNGGQQEETAERPAVPVRVQVVAPFNENLMKTYTGVLEGQNQAVIYAKIAEAVDSVLVREGDRVSAGQVLIKLDREGPTSNLRQAESVFRNAEKNYNKMKVLFEQGAISESQHDAAETDYQVARASYEAARQLVEAQSPIKGTVTSVNVRRGDFLQQGQVMATVAATDRLRVRFEVKTSDMNLVQLGDTVRVVSETINEALSGVVTAVAQSADPVSRAFEVEAIVVNAGSESGTAFRPGMFVRVQLIMQRLENVIGVPQGAVIALANGSAVYVVDDGVAFRRMVTLGAEAGGRVVIEHGLQPGDTVVTLGQSYLDDSTAVRVTDVEKGA